MQKFNRWVCKTRDIGKTRSVYEKSLPKAFSYREAVILNLWLRNLSKTVVNKSGWCNIGRYQLILCTSLQAWATSRTGQTGRPHSLFLEEQNGSWYYLWTEDGRWGRWRRDHRDETSDVFWKEEVIIARKTDKREEKLRLSETMKEEGKKKMKRKR